MAAPPRSPSRRRRPWAAVSRKTMPAGSDVASGASSLAPGSGTEVGEQHVELGARLDGVAVGKDRQGVGTDERAEVVRALTAGRTHVEPAVLTRAAHDPGEVQLAVGVAAQRFVGDGPVLLGTGGALQRALPKLGESFFVLYGDSYLPVDFRPIAEFFAQSGKIGLMTVFQNEGRYDTSNVVFGDGEIKMYDKKTKLPTMRHIDYGLSLFRASALSGWPTDKPFDLADVMQQLVAQTQLAGYEVKQRFYEIGSHAGLGELEELLSRK